MKAAALRQYIDSCAAPCTRVNIGSGSHGVVGLGQLLATLNTRRGKPAKAWAAPRIMFVLLLFSSSVFSANLSTPAETIDIQFEKSKLLRFELRIKRLESTIGGLRNELELLSAEQDSLTVKASALQNSLQLLAEKHARVTQQIPTENDVDMDARQRHANFEVYLAERKYNRALNALKENQLKMSRTSEYLQNRIQLLKRNRQGVAWQKQVLKKHRDVPTTQPDHRVITKRLAQAR